MTAIRPLLIDTDPGVDDAFAVRMALADPTVRVVGLTVGCGNVGLDHTVVNACRLADTAHYELPVYRGCVAPILSPPPQAGFVHGDDGFGDADLKPPSTRPGAEHAVDAIRRLAWEHQGALTLVCLGPLTHLATALLLEPDLGARIARLVVMGGAVTGRGNTERLNVEFNIGFDPEAADIVFRRWRGPLIELIDWEATLAHGIDFADIESWLLRDSPNARLLKAISQKRHAWVRAHRSASHSHLADALAMAVALEPALVTRCVERAITIELAGVHTRGQTVVDRDARSGAAPNARIVEALDPAGFARRVEQGTR